MIKAFTAAACLMLAGTFVGTASAQDIFVKFAGMPGASAVKDRGDWIEASSLTEGLNVAGTSAANPTGRGGKVTFDRITLTKELDAATLQLRDAAASGRPIPKVEIEVQQSSGKALVFYKVTLTGVLVQSVVNSVADGSGKIAESVSLAFEEIRWEFTPVDPKDGRQKSAVIGGWSVATNRKL